MPTGQLAEGAAKNLLLPRERGRGGCHPPRAWRDVTFKREGGGFYPPRKRGNAGSHHRTQNTISSVNGEQHLSFLLCAWWSQNNTMFMLEGKVCKSNNFVLTTSEKIIPQEESSELSLHEGTWYHRPTTTAILSDLLAQSVAHKKIATIWLCVFLFCDGQAGWDKILTLPENPFAGLPLPFYYYGEINPSVTHSPESSNLCL